MHPGSQLSSIATALDELTARVALIAEEMSGSGDEDSATTLFEVERSLIVACRRLNRMVDRFI